MKSWFKRTFRNIHKYVRRILTPGTSLAIMTIVTVGVASAPTIGSTVTGSVLVKATAVLTLSFVIDLLRSNTKARALYNLNGLLSTACIGITAYAIVTGGIAGLSGMWLIITLLLLSSFISGYILEKIELAPAVTPI